MMINHIITSSLVIIFVLLIGTIFENKISACLKYSLWLLVVIKLLLPFPGFESEFHILNFIESYAEIVSNGLENASEDKLLYEQSVTQDNNINNDITQVTAHNAREETHAETKRVQESETVTEDNNANKANGRMILLVIAKGVYLTGVMICFAAILVSNIRFYKAFKGKRKYISTYNDKIHVYKIEDYYGACLYGGVSPVIIVGNNTNLSMDQQHMIMLHEYVHYAHGDHIWSMIRNLCVALYWYNPLVWVAASVSRKDSELACDEGTIRRLGKSKRTAYGQTLLEVVSKASKKNDITSAVFLNSTTAARGKKEMKKRISVIAKRKKTSRIALVLTMALSIVCMGCTFGEPIDKTTLVELNDTEITHTGENKGTVNEVEEIVGEINDLESATLSVNDFRTEYQLCEQTITDDDKLKNLELWFRNAKRVSGAYDCGNNGASLLLKTASGQEIRMSLASDDCTIFAVNGIYYDYRPADKIDEGWYSNHVFDLFDQIPNVFEEANSKITQYVWPTVSTTISTTFGERVHPVSGEKKMINYVGIAGNEGDSIYAVADGDIIDVGFDNTLGNYIVLATLSGEEVTYGHLDGSKVPIGAQVKAGDMIGFMGKTGTATGTFLSISVKVNGEVVDPMLYLKTDMQKETITYNGKEYDKSELCNATLKWLELSEQDRMLSSYFPPEFMIFDETWGITLSAENITPTGITIICTQSGGEPTGELQTGSWYILETWTKEYGWKQMPTIIEGEMAWTQEAWMIPMEDACEWEVDWEWLYGTIPEGKYRIGKSIMDFRESGDFDTATYYAEFEIKK